MAVYTTAGKRYRRGALVGVGVLLVGLAAGYLVGRSSVTTVDDALNRSRERAGDAIAALGRLPIEYEQALTRSSGESNATMEASLRSARRLVEDAYDAAPWITRSGTREVTDAIGALLADVRSRASAATFEADVEAATSSIARLFGVSAQPGSS